MLTAGKMIFISPRRFLSLAASSSRVKTVNFIQPWELKKNATLLADVSKIIITFLRLIYACKAVLDLTSFGFIKSGLKIIFKLDD